MASSKKLPPTKLQLKQARKKSKERFLRIRNAEKKLARQLKQVAAQVGAIVRGFAPKGVVSSSSELTNALRRYAELIEPWAKRITASFIQEVAQRDANAWESAAKEIGQSLRTEIHSARLTPAMEQLQREQVTLIKSLSTEAADRVHRLTLEGLTEGTRAKEVAREIMKTGQVTANRAMLIARTETGRTATAVTEVRARHIGSEGYFWRTAEDADVREIHKKLAGTFHRWTEPPVSGENGERSHPGAIYNCRCYAEPVLPEIIT